MSEIIDILTLKPAESPYITGNNANFFGNLTNPGGVGIGHDFINVSQKKKFLQGDNFSLLSAAIVTPEAFTLWKDPAALFNSIPSIGLWLTGETTGHIYNVDVFGSANSIFITMENYEIAFDVFVNVKNMGINENFYITGTVSDCLISLKTAPTVFNTKNFIVSPVIKILHNFALS